MQMQNLQAYNSCEFLVFSTHFMEDKAHLNQYFNNFLYFALSIWKKVCVLSHQVICFFKYFDSAVFICYWITIAVMIDICFSWLILTICVSWCLTVWKIKTFWFHRIWISWGSSCFSWLINVLWLLATITSF